MKTTSNTPTRRRFAAVIATMVVLALIALTPTYLASHLTQYPTDSDASVSVSTTSEDGSKPLETVLVADSMTENDIGDESTVTTDVRDGRIFTIVVDDDATEILGKSSDYITITIGGETDFRAKNVTWIDSDCRIYVGPYNSEDLEDTSAYQKYTGAVRVVDEENRTSNDDCTLYWVDAAGSEINP